MKSHAELSEEVQRLRERLRLMTDAHKLNNRLKLNIERLLKQVGNKGRCIGCGAAVWWVNHKDKRKFPYTETGLLHFSNCPDAKDFKR